MRKFGKWIIPAVCFVAAVIYGGGKPTPVKPSVTVDPLLTLDASWFGHTTNIVGSVTNIVYDDTVHLKFHVIDDWQLLIPDSTPTYLDYETKGMADWQNAASVEVVQGEIHAIVNNATNCNYNLYLFYQPTPTNGVFHIDAKQPKDNVFIPLKVGIEADGEKITPTNEGEGNED